MADEYIDRDQAIAMHSAQDTALAAQAPKVVPAGWEGKKFTIPRFPSGIFAVTKSDGNYWGPFRADDFVIDPGTNIATAHDSTGEPVIIRMLNQADSNALCIDGDGEQVMYGIESVPDNTFEINDAGYGR